MWWAALIPLAASLMQGLMKGGQGGGGQAPQDTGAGQYGDLFQAPEEAPVEFPGHTSMRKKKRKGYGRLSPYDEENIDDDDYGWS